MYFVCRLYRRMSSSAGLHVPPNVVLMMKVTRNRHKTRLYSDYNPSSNYLLYYYILPILSNRTVFLYGLSQIKPVSTSDLKLLAYLPTCLFACLFLCLSVCLSLYLSLLYFANGNLFIALTQLILSQEVQNSRKE